MKKLQLKLFPLFLAAVMLVTVLPFSAAATSADQLRSSISSLESKSRDIESKIKSLQGQKNAQQELKEALASKISLLQQQINLCNNEIAKINSKIAANKAEINKKNNEIENDKLSFKKRLRAINMSNTGSSLQVLLGAENFSEFLQLSQMTSSVAARDKLMIEKLVAAVKVLEEKQKENNQLLEEQTDIKKTVASKQSELKSESDQIQSVINSINSDQTDLNQSNKQIEKQIKEYNATLAAMTTTNNTSFVYDGAAFTWPTPGYYKISAGFQSNDAVHRGTHNGIDITGNGRGAIAGARVVAIADGVVTRCNGSCSHNYPKSGSCGCGGGFGNYVTINHGTNNGNTYVVTYGHMASIAVGAGTTVKKGQTIGYVGTTGWSTGYHLHLGIAVNGRWVNPMKFYKKVG